MKKQIKFKKVLKWMGIVVAVLILLLVTIPLFIPVAGITGLNEPRELIKDNGAIVTLPFEGTDGLDIYYESMTNEVDTEDNYILIHGSLYNTQTWNEVFDYFGTKGNVYGYDQLPYGLSEKLLESEWTGKNPYTTEAAVEQLITFMDELGIESATLVGSSFGGVLAAEAAVKYEGRVDSLILVDAAIMVNESMPEWLITLPQVEHIGPLLAEGLAKGDGFYESTYYDKSLLTEERMKDNKLEIEVNNWNLAFWEYLQAWAVTPSDVSMRLGDISQSVLVISGDEDKIVPIEQSKEIASLIPNSLFVEITNCGHLPHEENPDEFMAIIDDWLLNIE